MATSCLYLSTTEAGSGKALVALGILEYALRKTTRVGFFRPIIRAHAPGQRDEDLHLVLSHFNLSQAYENFFGLFDTEVNELLADHQTDTILDRIIAQYKALEATCDFILCEGSDYQNDGAGFAWDLNREIVKNLGCPVFVLGNAAQRSLSDAIGVVQQAVEAYQTKGCPVTGILLNKADPDRLADWKTQLMSRFADADRLIAVLPFEAKLSSPRVRDVAEQLGAAVLYGHHRLDRLVSNYLIAAMQMQHAITWLQDGHLVITPGDRADMILGVLQADQSRNYPQLAGLLLSTGFHPEPALTQLIEGLWDPLPILLVDTDTYTTATQARSVHTTLRPTDLEKIQWSLNLFDENVDLAQLETQLNSIHVRGTTPKMFTYNLVQQAMAQKRHIVLPEGTDPRILQATAFLRSRDIVDITLLGDRATIELLIKQQGIALDLDTIKIIQPAQSESLETYTKLLYQLRQAKGMTLEAARDYALDPSYFGTLMVYHGEADGMVSGAAHTTQQTIRPALQIIKTQPNVTIASSIFFMCLDHGVVVYGDCAVNPNPTAVQLAEIAMTSAQTAQTFGIEPRVALLSYSSGASSEGEAVEKVRQATQLVQQRCPDLPIAGPIQYDAAVDPEVAMQKMPESPVAGRATVFIFPDLNTGNNTYKAVQRATGAMAIGPILQGLKKPVNDLSRGCTVEDVINTIVITAIQASAKAYSTPLTPVTG
jgi:phosphate acetyltransferase